jgi:adenosylcobinamide-GDP ribazoletransferase
MSAERPAAGVGAGVVHELRLFLIALQFLTRLPIPAAVGFEPVWLQQCVRHFPAVGLVVGGVAALVLWTAAHAFPAGVAVALSMVATIVLTGAFHEDGLADTFDALGGSASRERALEIMKDSRLGTYGTVALVAVLALKGLALHALLVRELVLTLAALPLAHAVSRAVPVLLLRWLPYAGDAEHAKAKPMAMRADGTAAPMAGVWALLALAVGAAGGFGGTALALALLAALAVALAMRRWLLERLGGFTGDTLGAAQQLAEVSVYLVLLAVLVRGA